MSDRPIADHGFLSDCRSAALVTSEGSVDWLCFPRFDSPSVFGRLLGDAAGHFALAPTGTGRAQRHYVEPTLVLETMWSTETGEAVATDALALGDGERGHRIGEGSPHALLRHVRCTSGEVEFEAEFVPRPEYGLARPLLCPTDRGIATRGGPGTLTLVTDVPLEVERGRATARFRLREGEDASFALQWARSWGEQPPSWEPGDVRRRLDDTIAAWRSWSDEHQAYEGPWADLVTFSGTVLQGLTFQPTGAIVAAATTSLPETVGGSRNWDYRYSWVRDASLTLDALWVAACPDEATSFLSWMVGAAAADLREGEPLQIMYGVGGEHDLSERELGHLEGWRSSRPVRVGNAAWDQRQLDVYGELLDAVHRLRDQLGDLDDASRGFLVDVADRAAEVWDEPDHGIWEVRGAPQHHLYSKLMCWVALDRAVELAGWLDAADRVEGWERTRDEIRAAILERGYSDRLDAFTQTFGSEALDASALTIPITGFLPGDDPRVRSTIAAIERDLTDERGLVYRYRSHDGLDGDEGTFLLCTFWLSQAHALGGDVDRAREVFELAAGYLNDVRLLAEEVDPGTGELLGNFPQAFSHVGLVTAAWAIEQAERGVEREERRAAAESSS